MKKDKHVFAIVLIVLVPLLSGACRKGKSSEEPPSAGAGEVVIWTYDSFISEWGPGPDVSKAFEEKTGIRVTWVSHGDAGEIASRLLLEANTPQDRRGAASIPDIILGLDQNLAPRVLDSGLLEAYRPAGAGDILPELVLDESFRLIPYDYSYFAIVYDSEQLNAPPRSLEELTESRHWKSLILMDPRISSPGLGFFAWVKAVYGSGWQDYWQRLEPSILTVAGSWSSGYGLFTRGEAPMALSYTTSPGYHLEYEDTERYKAAIFTDGHALQIEAAGLLAAAGNKDNAKLFLDFMLSPGFQNIIPLTNWMYPVTGIPLPPSFRVNPKSDKPLRPGPVTEAELNEWAALLMAQ